MLSLRICFDFSLSFLLFSFLAPSFSLVLFSQLPFCFALCVIPEVVSLKFLPPETFQFTSFTCSFLSFVCYGWRDVRKRTRLKHSFLHSLIFENLLCVRHCVRFWATSVNKIPRFSAGETKRLVIIIHSFNKYLLILGYSGCQKQKFLCFGKTHIKKTVTQTINYSCVEPYEGGFHNAMRICNGFVLVRRDGASFLE